MNIDQKYVVLDVETTGLKSKEDDLISISIYKPDTDKMYNRFLPLELRDSIPKEAAAVNGITKRMLKGKNPLTQDEVDWLIENFELGKRTILTYGTLDERFIKSYFNRHELYGYEEMSFFNFKSDIISSRFSNGTITKDNLCKLYKVGNITSVHSSENDCLLEWELFKKINGKKIFVDSENKVFEMTNDYIIPAGYLYTHPKLKNYVVNFTDVNVTLTEIRRFSVAGKELGLCSVVNFYGMTIEDLITRMINAEKVDAYPKLLENKSKLHYIGNLPSPDDIIPIYTNEDGTVATIRPQDKALEKRMNSFVKDFKLQMGPMVEFIRKDIFQEKPILSQELVVNRDNNVLALCDLSSTDAVLEIKVTHSLNSDTHRYQLYFESAGRDCFLMQTDWTGYPAKLEFIFSKVTFSERSIGERRGKHALDYRWKKFQEKIPNKNIIVTKYINQATDVELTCALCGNVWKSSPHKILGQPICPVCYPPEVTDKKGANDKPIVKPTEYDRKRQRELHYATRVFELTYGEVQLKQYAGSKALASFECTQCGYTWELRADKFIAKPWCPICIIAKKKLKARR